MMNPEELEVLERISGARDDRPSLERLFMTMAHFMALRSTCSRRSVGCLIVSEDDRHVLGMGYNGGASHQENGCERPKESGNCGCLHAEENAIINCYAPRSQPKKVFTTVFPCPQCAKRLVNLGGVVSLFYAQDYHTDAAINTLSRANIIIYQLHPLLFPKDFIEAKLNS